MSDLTEELSISLNRLVETIQSAKTFDLARDCYAMQEAKNALQAFKTLEKDYIRRPIEDIKNSIFLIGNYKQIKRRVFKQYIECEKYGVVTIISEDIFKEGVIVSQDIYCTGNDRAIEWLNKEVINA